MSSGHKRYHSHDAGPANEPSRTAKRCREPGPNGLSEDHEITPDKYTVGWVCALPLEMAAAKGMLDKLHPNPTEQDPSDHNTYLLGEVCGHNVVVACLPAGIYGTTSAATVAKDMLRTFKSIRFGLMVGIGGGIPSKRHDIRLGDIVVGQPSATNGGVIQYDRGNALQKQCFERTGSLNAPPQILLAALSRLQAEHLTDDSRIPEFLANLPQKMKKRFSHPGASNDCLYLAKYPHVKDNPTCEECDHSQTDSRDERDETDPTIHYGTIASGSQLIKDSKKRDQIEKSIGALCVETEAAGLQDFPSIVIRGICDYADSHKNDIWQFYAAAVAAAFAKELLSFMPPTRVLQVDPIPQLVSIFNETLDVSKQHLDVSSETLGEQKRTNKILEERPLDLHIVHEACYDSEDVGSSPRCEANTRVRIQRSIKQWADYETRESFLWLLGPAGTGKSTLIRSVADSFHEANRLVAGYFFKRGEQGRNDTNRLCSTLAVQLADAIPSFKDSLQASLGDTDKDSIDNKDLRFQFERLIKRPIQDLPPSEAKESARIIVIDALDECESPENLPRVLAFISEICNKSTALGLRVLLTSRPDPRIISAFEPLIQDGIARKLQLHRAFPEDTKDDIKLYLETNFMRIKIKANIQQDPWPSLAKVDRLVELSTHPEPLFIYAATLVRFIYDDRRLQNPKNQLKVWLKQCEDNKSQLHQIYNPVLEQIFALAKDTDFRQQLKFLGALVLVLTPLSLQSLSSLLCLDVDDVNWWLPGLHAVLDIPSKPHVPIRLLHKSFSDFLLSKENPGHEHLRIDALEVHGLLANRCIELMARCLKQDICKLRRLDMTSQEIDDARLNCHIPPELQYACLYWVYHLISNGNVMHERILPFLRHHFLHWLEVLAIIRRTSDGLKALRRLIGLIKGCSNGLTELLTFLKDATRTVSSFATIIEAVPLQTYASLLAFSPVASQVRQQFWDQRLPPRSHIEGVRSYWDAYVQTLHARSDVKNLEFSPDGSLLAAVDEDAVHLMNAPTGTYLTSFECPCEPKSVVFSSTSQLLAVNESSSRALTLWNTSTWTQVHKLECEGVIDTMAFSPDGASVITASVKSAIGHVTFELWDVRLGVLQRCTSVTKLRGSWEACQGEACQGVAFSPNLQQFATTHVDDTIILWNLEVCTAQHTINTANRPSVVAFSPDGKLFAAACGDVISIWDTATYTERCDYGIRDPGIFKKLTFSPNGELLASVTSKHVAFWETNTGYYRDFEVGPVSEVAFSSDSQHLATAKGATIKFWDMTDEYIQDDDEPSFPIKGRYFSCLLSSPKGKLVVSVKGDTVQIWDSFTGMLLRSLKHDRGEIHDFQFSPDGKELSFQSNTLQSWKWNMEDGSQEPMLEGYCQTLNRPVIYSANSQVSAVCRNDLIFNFYDTATGCHVGSLQDRIFNFRPVTLSPNGDLFAHWSSNGSIHVWDTKTGTRFLTIDNELSTNDLLIGERARKGARRPPGKTDRRLKFSPSGEILARHDVSGIKWWNLATDLRQHTIKPDDGFFQEHAFSPNSLLLATSFSPFPDDLIEQVIELYDAKTAEHQCTLSGHLGLAVHIVFSPDSLMVAVTSDDGTLRLWHTATFIPLHFFQTYHDIPEMTRFSEDGTFIAVASRDKSIRLWDLTTGRLLRIIYHDEGFIQGLRVLHDQVTVSVSAVEVDTLRDPWDTHNFKLLNYHYPLSADIQPSIAERFLSEASLDVDECWIMQGFEKVILIPPEYQPQKEVEDVAPETRLWIKNGHVLFIACVNGQVVSFRYL